MYISQYSRDLKSANLCIWISFHISYGICCNTFNHYPIADFILFYWDYVSMCSSSRHSFRTFIRTATLMLTRHIVFISYRLCFTFNLHEISLLLCVSEQNQLGCCSCCHWLHFLMTLRHFRCSCQYTSVLFGSCFANMVSWLMFI